MTTDRHPIDAGTRGYANPLDGTLYPYTPSTKKQAYAACQAAIDEAYARRSAIANKSLSEKELFRGVKHAQTLDDAQRSAWRLSHQFVAAPTKSPDADVHVMDNPRFMAAGSRSETLEEFRARSKREFVASHATPEPEHPSRTRAKVASKLALERVLYDGTVPQHLVDHAQLLVQMSESGDLQVYAKYHQEFVAGVLALDVEKQSTLSSQIEQLEAQKLTHYSLEEPVAGQPKPAPKPTGAPTFFSDGLIESAPTQEARDAMLASNDQWYAWRAQREQVSE